MREQDTIRFFDMFSGIGGFRAGLERAGGFTCIGHSEIDKHAEKAYRAVHNVKENEVYYEDARTIDVRKMPDFDLLSAGFPCQSFSIAGKRRGFDDARGTLFFEIARLARAKRPPYLLLENVPGLLSQNKGRTFTAILDTLSQLGYHVEWQVLNSKDFGVPQSRKRVYIVGYLDARCAGNILPVRGANPETLNLLINGRQGSRVYSADGPSKTLTARPDGAGTGLYAVGCGKNGQALDAALMIKEATKSGKKAARPGDSVDLSFSGFNTRRGRVGRGIAHTLSTSSTQGVVTGSLRIRRLTPRECFRLQGFSEEQIDKLLSIDSDTQSYKQAGNAVTVNVVHALGLRLGSVHRAIRGTVTAEKEGV